ncbi:cytochrome c oxidase assembly protein subunit 15 [Kwoniella heveanensis CBS 569]|nr:cytochrome c oxidase assembly protein subunit 15 [Kwoniella heveanensis CBS 569]
MSLGVGVKGLGLITCVRSQLVRPTLTTQSQAHLFRPTTTPLIARSLSTIKTPQQNFRLPFFSSTSSSSTYFYPSHSFRCSRGIATATAPPPPASASASSSTSTPAIPVIPRSLPYWLYGCSALVFGIIVIGGLTRLTESGLSIVEWQPITGILPPITKEEWDAEWEKYRLSPEGIMMNANIDMHEFKKIFYMEWGHRLAGRALGLLFVMPTVYYLTRYKLPRPIPMKLMLIGLGIGFQGALGWWMVKSGLDQSIVIDNSVPRVSQYRLAAHLSAAILLYLGMLSTAIGIQRDARFIKNPSLVSEISLSSVKKFRGMVHTAGMLVFLTVVTGAFVAGLDAGLVYNEFPYMGDGFVPPTSELLEDKYSRTGSDKVWRNMLENPVTAQFDHRVLAISTFTFLMTLPFVARRLPIKSTRRLTNLTAAAAITQVTLGISTLLYLVPIPLAAMHQAGSVVLLTCIMALAGSIRRPSRMLPHLRNLKSKVITKA